MSRFYAGVTAIRLRLETNNLYKGKTMANFCASCGTGLVEGSGFCQSCGTPVGGAAPVQQQQPVYQAAPKLKTKTAAVLLAVFLGYWSWLYTFKRDKLKFFIGVGVGVVAFIVGIASVVANISVITAREACIEAAYVDLQAILNCYYIYAPDYTVAYIFGFVAFGVNIWAIVDAARKKQDYFTNYPNGR